MVRILHPLLGAVVFLAAGIGGGRLCAQAALPSIGSRVRIRVENAGSATVGRLDSLLTDTMVVRSELTSAYSRVASRDVVSLEVFRRGSIAATAGVLTGTAGAVLGGIAYRNWCRDYTDACRENRIRSDSTNVDQHDRSIPAATAFVVGGAALGAILGYVHAPAQWDPIELPIRLGMGPTRRGFLVAAAIRLPLSH
jgi:hypothetical protein